MDFLVKLKEHIESLSYTPSTVNIGVYDEEQNSIAIRPTPSSFSGRDFDKGKVYPFNFQMLIHHSDNLEAHNMAQKLAEDLDELDVPIVSDNNTFVLIELRNTTLPNFVEDTIYGSLWTAMFEAELYIKGGQ